MRKEIATKRHKKHKKLKVAFVISVPFCGYSFPFGYNRAKFMGITIGTQLGSYEITALLGKGGMGEVYRARDTRLKREVAVKILPAAISSDPERVSRFQREAGRRVNRHFRNIRD